VVVVVYLNEFAAAALQMLAASQWHFSSSSSRVYLPWEKYTCVYKCEG